MNFIVRWLITALAVAFTVWLVPGIGFATAGNSVIDVVAFAIVLALLNMAVKPILQALSLPYHGAHVRSVLSGREYGNAVLGIGYLGWAVRR